jgi:outer membrane protein assembly factor BamB
MDRRQAVRLVGAGLASPWLARRADAAADSWPQFRGDPGLTGLARSALPTLKVAWAHEAGDTIESSAAIADGAVFVGSSSGQLLALDLATGKRRWSYATGAEIGESSPCIDGGLVYIGDLKGVVHAVSARGGAPAWTFKAKTQIKASPVVVSGKVLVGSYDQTVYALDARTGRLAWSFETEGQVHSTAGVDGGLVYVTGCDAFLRALRVADGKEMFRVASGAYTGASPALSNGRAFYGTFENEVIAVDLTGRKVVWRYRPERQFPFYSSAAVAAGRVVVGGRDKLIHALDAATGKAAWTFATRARVDSSPLIAGGKVCVASGDGRVYVLDLAKGAKLEEHDAGSPISASPALAAGRLVIGTQDGQVIAFGPPGSTAR